MTKVKCIRNDSKSLPFQVGETYNLGYHFGGGLYEVICKNGSKVQATLNGYYLEFVEVK